MALKLPKLPYKFLIIGIILIIIYYVYTVSANAERSAKEPFTLRESIFDKALDRLNPLAASQNPLTNQAVIRGISEGDGITTRVMNQMALNIPTVSLAYEQGPNGWTILPSQCNKANTYVESSPTQCSPSGMRQKYLYQSDAGGACIQQAEGDPECDPTCPGANAQGGCNYHACEKTGQVPFSEVTDISQCDALGNRQAYAWASSPSGACTQDISGSPTCDAIRCPGANTLNGCAYCDTNASTKPTCPGYIAPYTCTRADTPPADTCNNYKKRPVSWTNAKATATNAAQCTAVTYGTAVCDSSCSPPQQSTDASGCNYVAPVAASVVVPAAGPAGTGSWWGFASSSTGQFLVTGNANNGYIYTGYIYTSSDYGVTWTPRTSAGTGYWYGFASDSTGQFLVTGNAANDSIYTSSDYGVSWTPRTSAGAGSWYGFASSSTGQFLVTGYAGGYIYTSSDYGVSWTSRTSAGTGFWYGFASDSTGRYLVTGKDGGYIYTSTDYGVSWTPRTSAGAGAWQGVASSSTGQFLVTGKYGGYIYTSTDYGVSWTPRTSAGARFWQGVASSSTGQFLVTGNANNGPIYTSSDYGVTWTPRTNGAPSQGYWYGFASDSTGQFLVTGNANNGPIYTSSDYGSNWIQR